MDTTAAVTELVRRQHATVLDLRARTGAALTDAWQRIQPITEQDAADWTGIAVPTVRAAQRSAAVAVTAYVPLMVTVAGHRPVRPPVDVEGLLDDLRAGTDPAEVYTRPVVTVRALTAEGRSFTDALGQGLTKAITLGMTDVMLANRDAFTAAASGEPSIDGFQRVLSGQACEFCQEAAGETYSTDDLMPLHDRCDCTVAPVIGSHEPGAAINDALGLEPPPDGLDVTVEDHGELGPVLVDASHHFTR